MSSGHASATGGPADELIVMFVGIGAVGAAVSLLLGAWSEGAKWLAVQGVLATEALVYTVPGVPGVGLDSARALIGVGVVVGGCALGIGRLQSMRQEM